MKFTSDGYPKDFHIKSQKAREEASFLEATLTYGLIKGFISRNPPKTQNKIIAYIALGWMIIFLGVCSKYELKLDS